MDHSNFEQIKQSVTSLLPHIQVDLVPAFDEEFIEAFARYLHPHADMMADAGRCTVHLPTGFLVYTLYTTGIVRTDRQSGKKVFYQLPSPK